MSRARITTWLFSVLLGFLALTAQTLLLRRFLWRVEATEIGVGIFLSTWLAWVGVGAWLAHTRIGDRLVSAWTAHFPFALMLYLPASGLQGLCMDHLRAISGVADYLASPLGHLALGMCIVNAPVSLLTGLLFPMASRWLAQRGGNANVAYACDTAGAVMAGALVTLLLVAGVRLEGSHLRDWQRMFPDGHPEGRFVTPAATYLHGMQGGTWYVLSAGNVVDAYPEPEHAAEIAALLLSQKPDAKRILLLGHAPIALACALIEFQPRTHITWCHDDPAYAQRVVQWLNPHPTRRPSSIDATDENPQAFLSHLSEGFDCVCLCPASPATAAGAAMREVPFLKQVRSALAPDGLVALPIGGDAGAWSPEQQRLVGTVLDHAGQVWTEDGRLIPGAGCWWLASSRRGIVVGPDVAAAQFKRLGVTRVPAALVAEFYDPMRAAQMLASCAREMSTTSETSFVQRQGLALTWHMEWPGVPFARHVAWSETHGGSVLFVLILALAWMLPVAWGDRTRAPARFILVWLAAGSFLGLTGLFALMRLLEMYLGNLYLLAGLSSSLYLAGLFAGNRCMTRRHVDARLGSRDAGMMFLVVIAHGCLLLAMTHGVTCAPSPAILLSACFLAGVPTGGYVPLAVARLRKSMDSESKLGARIFGADAMGSAWGGLATSLILLPWMGSVMACLGVFVLALGVSSCALVLSRARWIARMVCLACLAGCIVCVMRPLAAQRHDNSRMRHDGFGLIPAAYADETPLAGKLSAGSNTTSQMTAKTNSVAPVESVLLPPLGKPRAVDMDRLRQRQSKGELSTNAATFCAPEKD